jgi:hypothetical protein
MHEVIAALIIAAIIGGAAAITGAVTGVVSAVNANNNAQESLALAQENQSLQENQAIIGLQSDALSLEGDLAQNEIAILETEGKISDYETFLAGFPAYADYQKAAATAEGKQQFDQLMGNFEMQAVQAAASGRAGAGTSAQQVTNKRRSDVVSFVGEDMTLDAEGGLFGQGFTQLVNDLTQQQTTAQTQLGIYQSSLTTLKDSKGDMEQGLTDLNAEIAALMAQNAMPQVG